MRLYIAVVETVTQGVHGWFSDAPPMSGTGVGAVLARVDQHNQIPVSSTALGEMEEKLNRDIEKTGLPDSWQSWLESWVEENLSR